MYCKWIHECEAAPPSQLQDQCFLELLECAVPLPRDDTSTALLLQMSHILSETEAENGGCRLDTNHLVLVGIAFCLFRGIGSCMSCREREINCIKSLVSSLFIKSRPGRASPVYLQAVNAHFSRGALQTEHVHYLSCVMVAADLVDVLRVARDIRACGGVTASVSRICDERLSYKDIMDGRLSVAIHEFLQKGGEAAQLVGPERSPELLELLSATDALFKCAQQFQAADSNENTEVPREIEPQDEDHGATERVQGREEDAHEGGSSEEDLHEGGSSEEDASDGEEKAMKAPTATYEPLVAANESIALNGLFQEIAQAQTLPILQLRGVELNASDSAGRGGMGAGSPPDDTEYKGKGGKGEGRKGGGGRGSRVAPRMKHVELWNMLWECTQQRIQARRVEPFTVSVRAKPKRWARVMKKHFRVAPRGWQESAFESIEDPRQGGCVLVTAPTGSGKTHVAMCAVSRVLQKGDEGRLIYVVPTKALANQIFMDVLFHISKLYGCGVCNAEKLVGINTKEVKMHTLAQVIITVPQTVLQWLSMPSPPKVIQHVNTIILDEAHKVQDQRDGDVWERLILLAPRSAKLILLSATVSQPQQFRHWLMSVVGVDNDFDENICSDEFSSFTCGSFTHIDVPSSKRPVKQRFWIAGRGLHPLRVDAFLRDREVVQTLPLDSTQQRDDAEELQRVVAAIQFTEKMGSARSAPALERTPSTTTTLRRTHSETDPGVSFRAANFAKQSAQKLSEMTFSGCMARSELIARLWQSEEECPAYCESAVHSGSDRLVLHKKLCSSKELIDFNRRLFQAHKKVANMEGRSLFEVLSDLLDVKGKERRTSFRAGIQSGMREDSTDECLRETSLQSNRCIRVHSAFAEDDVLVSPIRYQGTCDREDTLHIGYIGADLFVLVEPASLVVSRCQRDLLSCAEQVRCRSRDRESQRETAMVAFSLLLVDQSLSSHIAPFVLSDGSLALAKLVIHASEDTPQRCEAVTALLASLTSGFLSPSDEMKLLTLCSKSYKVPGANLPEVKVNLAHLDARSRPDIALCMAAVKLPPSHSPVPPHVLRLATKILQSPKHTYPLASTAMLVAMAKCQSLPIDKIDPQVVESCLDPQVVESCFSPSGSITLVGHAFQLCKWFDSGYSMFAEVFSSLADDAVVADTDTVASDTVASDVALIPDMIEELVGVPEHIVTTAATAATAEVYVGALLLSEHLGAAKSDKQRAILAHLLDLARDTQHQDMASNVLSAIQNVSALSYTQVLKPVCTRLFDDLQNDALEVSTAVQILCVLQAAGLALEDLLDPRDWDLLLLHRAQATHSHDIACQLASFHWPAEMQVSIEHACRLFLEAGEGGGSLEHRVLLQAVEGHSNSLYFSQAVRLDMLQVQLPDALKRLRRRHLCDSDQFEGLILALLLPSTVRRDVALKCNTDRSRVIALCGSAALADVICDAMPASQRSCVADTCRRAWKAASDGPLRATLLFALDKLFAVTRKTASGPFECCLEWLASTQTIAHLQHRLLMRYETCLAVEAGDESCGSVQCDTINDCAADTCSTCFDDKSNSFPAMLDSSLLEGSWDGNLFRKNAGLVVQVLHSIQQQSLQQMSHNDELAVFYLLEVIRALRNEMSTALDAAEAQVAAANADTHADLQAAATMLRRAANMEGIEEAARALHEVWCSSQAYAFNTNLSRLAVKLALDCGLASTACSQDWDESRTAKRAASTAFSFMQWRMGLELSSANQLTHNSISKEHHYYQIVLMLRERHMLPAIFFSGQNIQEVNDFAAFCSSQKSRLFVCCKNDACWRCQKRRYALLHAEEALTAHPTALAGNDLEDRMMLQMLRNGIGFHHSQVSKEYRMEVENLFRAGHLQLVVATGTLAVGVHMPARTVVMMSDSRKFLTKSEVAQMSGRAGRPHSHQEEGEEEEPSSSVGHVIFSGGFYKNRVEQLLFDEDDVLQASPSVDIKFLINLMEKLQKVPTSEEQVRRALLKLVYVHQHEAGYEHLSQWTRTALQTLCVLGLITPQLSFTPQGHLFQALSRGEWMDSPEDLLFVGVLPTIADLLLPIQDLDERVALLTDVLLRFYPEQREFASHEHSDETVEAQRDRLCLPPLEQVSPAIRRRMDAFNTLAVQMMLYQSEKGLLERGAIHQDDTTAPSNENDTDCFAANRLKVGSDSDTCRVAAEVQALSGHAESWIECPRFEWLAAVEGLKPDLFPLVNIDRRYQKKHLLAYIFQEDLTLADIQVTWKVMRHDAEADLQSLKGFVEKLHKELEEMGGEHEAAASPAWLTREQRVALERTLCELLAKMEKKIQQRDMFERKDDSGPRCLVVCKSWEVATGCGVVETVTSSQLWAQIQLMALLCERGRALPAGEEGRRLLQISQMMSQWLPLHLLKRIMVHVHGTDDWGQPALVLPLHHTNICDEPTSLAVGEFAHCQIFNDIFRAVAVNTNHLDASPVRGFRAEGVRIDFKTIRMEGIDCVVPYDERNSDWQRPGMDGEYFAFTAAYQYDGLKAHNLVYRTNRLHVSGLEQDVTSAMLHRAFNVYNPIRVDAIGARRFGYVTLETTMKGRDLVDTAVKDEHSVDGVSVQVQKAYPQSPIYHRAHDGEQSQGYGKGAGRGSQGYRRESDSDRQGYSRGTHSSSQRYSRGTHSGHQQYGKGAGRGN